MALTLSRQGDADQGLPVTPTAGWKRLPDPPLSPRADAIVFGAGSRIVVVGGTVANFCPPTADCVSAGKEGKDGATFDPAAQRWAPIAEAPFPLSSTVSHVTVGNRLVAAQSDEWAVLDADKGTWSRLPAPPEPVDYPQLTAFGEHVYTLAGRRLLDLDLTSRTWSTLSTDTLEPHLGQRSLAATPDGVVMFGVDSSQPNDGRTPSYQLADRFSGGTWTRLPRSDLLAGGAWTWTGTRLVNPDYLCVDGGEVDPYPRCVPQGGLLDPATGDWSELPKGPDQQDVGGYPISTSDDGPLRAAGGYLFDDREESWTRLVPPSEEQDRLGIAASVIDSEGTVAIYGGVRFREGQGPDPDVSSGIWVLHP
jgi:hypothetical protein